MENLFIQVYMAVRPYNTNIGALNIADEAVKQYGNDPVSASDLALIIQNLIGE